MPKKNRRKLTCAECGATFFVTAGRVRRGAKFCSMSCSVSAQMRAQHAARRKKASAPGLKVCSKCGEEKPRSEFYKHTGNYDGLRGECKACVNAKSAKWRAANHDRKREIDRAYYEREAERIGREAKEKYAAGPEIRERNREWRRRNPEKVREQNQRKRKKYGHKLRAARRQHYRDNKGRYVAQARARDDRIKRATPPWADLKAIEEFYVQAERLTRETGIKHHVDHFYPLQGKTMCGLHVEANLRVIPAGVNLAKGNAIQAEAGEPLCCAWPTVMQLPA